jgi:CRISPR-associated protein Cmr3
MSSTTELLALVPRDGFFVKDGRGWQTSARTSVLDWPWPTTIRGALTTVSGKIAERQQGSRFGPKEWREHQSKITIGATVALRRPLCGEKWCRMWPVPADALWLEEKDKVLPLDPTRPHTCTLGRTAPAGAPDGYAEAREALWVAQVEYKAKPLGRPRWWDDATLTEWLAGDSVDVQPREQWPRMASRLQTHVGIRSETLTGDDGILFAHDVIETLERLPRDGATGAGKVAEWAIGVQVAWPDQSQSEPEIARLGSDSRIAWIEKAGDPDPRFRDLFGMGEIQKAFDRSSKGLRLIVMTPACFTGGWLPDGFAPVQDGKSGWVFRGRLAPSHGASAEICKTDLILRAALVPRPMHISGWDMAAKAADHDGAAKKDGKSHAKSGAARPTSRLVPPGAVYFLERADRRNFTADDAKALWLAALGSRTNEGFGRVVPGIWNPKDTD